TGQTRAHKVQELRRTPVERLALSAEEPNWPRRLRHQLPRRTRGARVHGISERLPGVAARRYRRIRAECSRLLRLWQEVRQPRQWPIAREPRQGYQSLRALPGQQPHRRPEAYWYHRWQLWRLYDDVLPDGIPRFLRCGRLPFWYRQF